MYSIESAPEVDDQVAALPALALADYAEVMVVLEVAPWSGAPYNRDRPEANMRTMPFAEGRALLTYMVLDDQRRVVLLQLLWWG